MSKVPLQTLHPEQQRRRPTGPREEGAPPSAFPACMEEGRPAPPVAAPPSAPRSAPPSALTGLGQALPPGPPRGCLESTPGEGQEGQDGQWEQVGRYKGQADQEG